MKNQTTQRRNKGKRASGARPAARASKSKKQATSKPGVREFVARGMSGCYSKSLFPPAEEFAAQSKGLKIILVPSAEGSMDLKRAAGGWLNLQVSESQYRCLALCFDIVRLYNDDHLKFFIKSEGASHGYPENSRSFRDPVIAAHTNRVLDEWLARSRAEEEARRTLEKASPSRIGI